jgi:deoxyribodipyrimidine photo-lyase
MAQQTGSIDESKRFLQQVCWREYFHQVHHRQPHLLWQDIEPYKTGFTAEEYANALPKDIEHGVTGVEFIDALINQLITTGYLHNCIFRSHLNSDSGNI